MKKHLSAIISSFLLCHTAESNTPPTGSSVPSDLMTSMLAGPLRDIQPILNKHCVRCHDTEHRAGNVVLTGDHGPWFSMGYASLMLGNLVAHGKDGNSNIAPRNIGSSASPLMQLIAGTHYDVKVSPLEAKWVRLWIESGAPYAGTYAVGQAIYQWCANGEKLKPENLKMLYASAFKRGREVAQTILAKRKALRALNK